MKTRILFLIALSAVVTLSFTFATSKEKQKKEQQSSISHSLDKEPLGGFVSDEK